MPQGVRCPACGTPFSGEYALPAVCTRCGVRFYFDEFGSLVPHVAECSLNESDATARVREWAATVKGGKEFSRHFELARMELRYYPLFVFSRAQNGSPVRIVASAVPDCEPGITSVNVIPPSLKEAVDWSNFTPPKISPASYGKIMNVDPSSRALVFYPFWCTQYVYRGKLSKVTIDACNGYVSGDLNVEIEKRNPLPAAAASLVAITLEGALAYFNWLFALTAITVTGAFFIYTSREWGVKE